MIASVLIYPSSLVAKPMKKGLSINSICYFSASSFVFEMDLT